MYSCEYPNWSFAFTIDIWSISTYTMIPKVSCDCGIHSIVERIVFHLFPLEHPTLLNKWLSMKFLDLNSDWKSMIVQCAILSSWSYNDLVCIIMQINSMLALKEAVTIRGCLILRAFKIIQTPRMIIKGLNQEARSSQITWVLSATNKHRLHWALL